MINLNDLAEQAHSLAQLRELKVDIFSTLKHCAGEVTEAVEAFTKLDRLYDRASPNLADSLFKSLGSELADIIICVLTASYEAGINIEEAIYEAMQKNARRAYETE